MRAACGDEEGLHETGGYVVPDAGGDRRATIKHKEQTQQAMADVT